MQKKGFFNGIFSYLSALSSGKELSFCEKRRCFNDMPDAIAELQSYQGRKEEVKKETVQREKNLQRRVEKSTPQKAEKTKPVTSSPKPKAAPSYRQDSQKPEANPLPAQRRDVLRQQVDTPSHFGNFTVRPNPNYTPGSGFVIMNSGGLSPDFEAKMEKNGKVGIKIFGEKNNYEWRSFTASELAQIDDKGFSVAGKKRIKRDGQLFYSLPEVFFTDTKDQLRNPSFTDAQKHKFKGQEILIHRDLVPAEISQTDQHTSLDATTEGTPYKAKEEQALAEITVEIFNIIPADLLKDYAKVDTDGRVFLSNPKLKELIKKVHDAVYKPKSGYWNGEILDTQKVRELLYKEMSNMPSLGTDIRTSAHIRRMSDIDFSGFAEPLMKTEQSQGFFRKIFLGDRTVPLGNRFNEGEGGITNFIGGDSEYSVERSFRDLVSAKGFTLNDIKRITTEVTRIGRDALGGATQISGVDGSFIKQLQAFFKGNASGEQKTRQEFAAGIFLLQKVVRQSGAETWDLTKALEVIGRGKNPFQEISRSPFLMEPRFRSQNKNVTQLAESFEKNFTTYLSQSNIDINHNNLKKWDVSVGGYVGIERGKRAERIHDIMTNFVQRSTKDFVIQGYTTESLVQALQSGQKGNDILMTTKDGTPVGKLSFDGTKANGEITVQSPDGTVLEQIQITNDTDRGSPWGITVRAVRNLAYFESEDGKASASLYAGGEGAADFLGSDFQGMRFKMVAGVDGKYQASEKVALVGGAEAGLDMQGQSSLLLRAGVLIEDVMGGTASLGVDGDARSFFDDKITGQGTRAHAEWKENDDGNKEWLKEFGASFGLNGDDFLSVSVGIRRGEKGYRDKLIKIGRKVSENVRQNPEAMEQTIRHITGGKNISPQVKKDVFNAISMIATDQAVGPEFFGMLAYAGITAGKMGVERFLSISLQFVIDAELKKEVFLDSEKTQALVETFFQNPKLAQLSRVTRRYTAQELSTGKANTYYLIPPSLRSGRSADIGISSHEQNDVTIYADSAWGDPDNYATFNNDGTVTMKQGGRAPKMNVVTTPAGKREFIFFFGRNFANAVPIGRAQDVAGGAFRMQRNDELKGVQATEQAPQQTSEEYKVPEQKDVDAARKDFKNFYESSDGKVLFETIEEKLKQSTAGTDGIFNEREIVQVLENINFNQYTPLKNIISAHEGIGVRMLFSLLIEQIMRRSEKNWEDLMGKNPPTEYKNILNRRLNRQKLLALQKKYSLPQITPRDISAIENNELNKNQPTKVSGGTAYMLNNKGEWTTYPAGETELWYANTSGNVSVGYFGVCRNLTVIVKEGRGYTLDTTFTHALTTDQMALGITTLGINIGGFSFTPDIQHQIIRKVLGPKSSQPQPNPPTSPLVEPPKGSNPLSRNAPTPNPQGYTGSVIQNADMPTVNGGGSGVAPPSGSVAVRPR